MMMEHIKIIEAGLWKAVDIGGKYNTSSVYLDRQPASIHMPLLKVFGLGATPEDIQFFSIDMARTPAERADQYSFDVVGINAPGMMQ